MHNGLLSTQLAAVASSIAELYPADTASLRKAGGFFSGGNRFIRIGGSTDARDSATAQANAGQVTGDGTTLTVTLATTESICNGMPVSLGCPVPGNTFDNNYAYGKITVITDTKFTVPYVGSAGVSSGTWNCMFTNRFSNNSCWRELLTLYKGGLELVANLGVGSTNTLALMTRCPDIVAMQPHFVIGSLGLGNLFLGGVSADTAIAVMTGFVNYLTNNGIRVLCELPMGTRVATGVDWAWANKVYKALYKLMVVNRLFYVTDPAPWSIDPATGLVKANYVVNGDNVHPNRDANVKRAADIYQILIGQVPLPTATPLASSILDRRLADAGCDNIFDGLWTNAGLVTATSVETGGGSASGNVVPEVTIITTNGGGSAAACSVVQRTVAADGDDCGYNQQVDVTFTANNNVVDMEFGPANMATRILADKAASPGQEIAYRVYCMLEVTPSATGIKNMDCYVVGEGMTYGAAPNIQTGKTCILGGAIYSNSITPDPRVQTNYKGLLCSDDIVIPADLTAMTKFAVHFKAVAYGAGTVTMKIGRLTVRRVR